MIRKGYLLITNTIALLFAVLFSLFFVTGSIYNLVLHPLLLTITPDSIHDFLGSTLMFYIVVLLIGVLIFSLFAKLNKGLANMMFAK